MAHNTRRGCAEQVIFHLRPVRSHHDQIGLQCLRNAQDLVIYDTVPHGRRCADLSRNVLRYERSELASGLVDQSLVASGEVPALEHRIDVPDHRYDMESGVE